MVYDLRNLLKTLRSSHVALESRHAALSSKLQISEATRVEHTAVLETAAAAAAREVERAVAGAAQDAARAAAARSSLEEIAAELTYNAGALRDELSALRAEFSEAQRASFLGDFQVMEAVQELGDRAAMFDRTFNENKRLHNMLQDLKGSIRVFCRVRPHVDGMDTHGELDVVEVTTDDDGVASGLMVSVDKGGREGVVQKG